VGRARVQGKEEGGKSYPSSTTTSEKKPCPHQNFLSPARTIEPDLEPNACLTCIPPKWFYYYKIIHASLQPCPRSCPLPALAGSSIGVARRVARKCHDLTTPNLLYAAHAHTRRSLRLHRLHASLTLNAHVPLRRLCLLFLFLFRACDYVRADTSKRGVPRAGRPRANASARHRARASMPA
jgi:hypothetical protein